MSKVQDVIDKLLPAVGVIVSGEFLREPGVLAFFDVLKYWDVPANKETEKVSEEMKTCRSYTIWCSIADDQLPFGPTLKIQGEGQPGKITIPWRHVMAIIQLHEPIRVPRLGFKNPAT